MGQDFRIGLRFELVPGFQQTLFELKVILNDAVVNKVELAAAIRVRMGVRHAGLAMRGPTRVGDSGNTGGRSIPHLAFEFGDFAHGAGKIGRTIHNENAAGVVAAVFQPFQPVNQDTLGGLISCVRYNSTHSVAPLAPSGMQIGMNRSVSLLNAAMKLRGRFRCPLSL